jgi:hypothetical protein
VGATAVAVAVAVWSLRLVGGAHREAAAFSRGDGGGNLYGGQVSGQRLFRKADE